METLTKENFWNDLKEKYPEEMKRFCEWIDEYKKRVDWERLFASTINAQAPKYHDLPIAMQFGIFLQFAKESWNQVEGPLATEFREQTTTFITSYFVRKIQFNEMAKPYIPKE